MKQLVLLITGVLLNIALFSQTCERNVVSSAGGFLSNTDMSFSFTIGEMAVQTLQNTNIILTQGFQQPYTEPAIVVSNKAEFSFIVDTLTNTVTFTNTSTGTINRYYWNMGDNTFSNNTSVTHKYSQGAFNACLTVIDTVSGVQSQYCSEIKIGKIYCKADFVYSLDTATKTVSFTDKSAGTPTSWNWQFGDYKIAIIQNVQHAYTTYGYYNVKLAIMNVGGCMDEKMVEIQVSSSIEPPANDCKVDYISSVDLATNIVSFFDQSKGYQKPKYHWDFGDNTNDIKKNPSHKFNGGFFNVCLTVEDSVSKCKNINCQTIKTDNLKTTCNAIFRFGIDANTDSVYFFDRSKGDIDTWAWNFGDSIKSSLQDPVHFYADSGYYNVTLTVSNSISGCSSKYLNIINVRQKSPRLKAGFTYTADFNKLHKGVLPVEFKGVWYGDASEVDWDFGDGASNTSTMSPTHEYIVDSMYHACLTLANPKLNASDQYCEGILIIVTSSKVLISPDNELVVFPNPTSDNIIIRFANENAYILELTNIVGQILQTKQVNAFNGLTEQLNLRDLPTGMYLLKVKTVSGSIIKKIVKE